MATTIQSLDVPGVSPYVLALRQACEGGAGKKIAEFTIGQLDVEVRTCADSVWAFIRRAGRGGVALRAAYITGEFSCSLAEREAGEDAKIVIKSDLGEHTVVLDASGEALEFLRVTASLTP